LFILPIANSSEGIIRKWVNSFLIYFGCHIKTAFFAETLEKSSLDEEDIWINVYVVHTYFGIAGIDI
jgi:hypothetical protein